MRNQAGLFIGAFIMKNYPKKILSIQDQYQTYIDGGLTIPDKDQVLSALNIIGYYRLRGYCFHLYDNQAKQYKPGTTFDQILNAYYFDKKISSLILSITSQIEVALRVRFSEAILSNGDPLAYLDPSVFQNKKDFWKNLGMITSEINRSGDAFIQHNYQKHEGMIPVWAVVEVMSFGTLSKCIKNLIPSTAAYKTLAGHYKYRSLKGNEVVPNIHTLSSWIHSVVVIRNLCAHNSRIYNRTISTKPVILAIDKPASAMNHFGLYQSILAMKYLRPSDEIWSAFSSELIAYVNQSGLTDAELHFPSDWKTHLIL